VEYAAPDESETVARYRTLHYEAVDANYGTDSMSRVQIARLRCRFALKADDRAGYTSLALARIVEVRADRQIVLDHQFIPPCGSCGASAVLSGFLSELEGMLHHRGMALAGRVSDGNGRGGSGEIADFLLLQAVNRYEPLFAHYAGLADLHPETFYALAA